MITILRSDDWTAIYEHDKCIWQDHSITPEVMLYTRNVYNIARV